MYCYNKLLVVGTIGLSTIVSAQDPDYFYVPDLRFKYQKGKIPFEDWEVDPNIAFQKAQKEYNIIDQSIEWLERLSEFGDAVTDRYTEGGVGPAQSRYSYIMGNLMVHKLNATRRIPVSLYENLINQLGSGNNDRMINQNICRSRNGPEYGCTIPLTLSGIWGYGCWCNFGYNIMEGKGDPVDEYDNICRKLQTCMKCTARDAESNGDSCDPKTQDYDINFRWTSGIEGMMADCSVQNDDPCAQHTCSCELNLLAELLELFWSETTLNKNYDPENGWDPSIEGNCMSNKVEHVQTVGCCGHYPNRHQYGAGMDCCENAIFNPFTHHCCEDGTVKFNCDN